MEEWHLAKFKESLVKGRGSKILDIYIIKNFLGTFIFALSLLMFIVVVFDLSEKLDEFIEKQAPLKAIIFEYYLNFIPFFALLFSPLFTFITVIFFTSKLAYNTEIIAMFSSGLSFKRLMLPYFIASFVIAAFTFVLGNFVIPHANIKRLEFEEVYVHKSGSYSKRNIHMQVRPNEYVYMESYSNTGNIGYKFSLEKFNETGELESKLMADYVKWDTVQDKWKVHNYYIRNIYDGIETIEEGKDIDTVLNIFPKDFARGENFILTMDMKELKEFIDQQQLKGSENVIPYLLERYKRLAIPFSTFILTLIGVSVSSRKIRGGIGANIGAGLGLSFIYIFFMQFSSQFAISGALNPLLAVWMPNILFAIIAGILYYKTPK
ncbi:MAG: LptF/LptG family permease [Bacteroidales bacterium]|nr:LptF/LptG family permease [Bacteroidales bacterium]